MEEATTTPIEQTPLIEPPKPTLSAFTPIVRVIFSVLLALGGIIFAVRTIIVSLTTIRLIPAFVFFSMDRPYSALLGTIIYVGGAFLSSVLCVLSFTFVRRLIKRESIASSNIIVFIIVLILTFAIDYAVIPCFSSIFGA